MVSTKMKIPLFAFACVVLALPAAAQDRTETVETPVLDLLMPADGDGDRARRGERRGKARQIFSMMDVNKDRSVSREEFLILPTERFGAIDGNGDGTITPAEIDQALQARVEAMRERMVERLDADRDGLITQAEFQAQAEQRFSQLDRNNDGELSRRDFRGSRDRDNRN
ncbi:MAG: EF-hand domain-containing protein [Pseudomonadota bacterium]